ncbi:MAG: hypothetical protein H0V26_02205 [Solirubrobacterales bacterium]|nr:hypothetical protein [Solirubrobacterales bacterium]
MVPYLAGALRADYNESLLAIKELLLSELASGGSLEGRFPSPVQWFITPMPSQAMLLAFNEIGVVYMSVPSVEISASLATKMPA